MPEENEFTAPATGAAGNEDAEAVLELQEIASEEPDVEAHAMALSTASGGAACSYSCSGTTLA
jgi:hypothetical protein